MGRLAKPTRSVLSLLPTHTSSLVHSQCSHAQCWEHKIYHRPTSSHLYLHIRHHWYIHMVAIIKDGNTKSTTCLSPLTFTYTYVITSTFTRQPTSMLGTQTLPQTYLLSPLPTHTSSPVHLQGSHRQHREHTLYHSPTC